MLAAVTAVPPRRPRVVVAGGGVGGLALAVGLRARGVANVTVLERGLDLASSAARATGLSLWPNGLAALRLLDKALHLDALVFDAGVPLLSAKFHQGGLATPASVSDMAELGRRYALGPVTVRWGTLTGLLAAALPAATVSYGTTLLGQQLTSDGSLLVRVSREGQPAEDIPCDVLVGADGIRSAVRAMLLQDGPPRDAGRVAWRAVVAATPELDAACPRGSSLMAASPAEGRTMTVMHVGEGAVYWALGCLDGAVVDGADAAGTVAATFASWPLTAALLAATPRDALLTQRLADRPPISAASLLGAGPVTLLGDALHAMIPSLGQGAGSALEGALELAEAIAEAEPGALVAALRSYEAARLPRATAIQQRSFASGAKAYGKEAPDAAKESDGLDWVFSYRRGAGADD